MEKEKIKVDVFSLINGTFNPADAASLISNLYNDKIEFHNRQLLKCGECNDGSEKGLAEQQRIDQLKTQRLKFHLCMKEAIDRNCDVIIKSNIEVLFLERS